MYLLEVLLLSGVTLSLQHLVKDGVPCECKESSRCSYWISAVKRGKYLDLPVCGYDPNTLAPLLCCPGSDVEWTGKGNRSKREVQSLKGMDNIQLSCTITSKLAASPAQIADEKCAEYGKLIYQSLYEVSIGGSPLEPKTQDTCAKTDEKNEDNAEPREFPHMALIGYGEDKIRWLCGGSLISERFILTVAVCVDTSTKSVGKAKWVKLGELDLSTDDDVARPQIFKVSQRFVHPDFNRSISYYDIGLLKLDRDVPFTIYVRPACVFTRRDPPDNKADATGWGTKRFGEATSDILKKVKMDLVTTEECNKQFNRTGLGLRNIPQGIRGDLILCAVETDPEGLQICVGDSGGPLQIALKKPYCMYGIIGLTSFGVKCGNKMPGGFTRVAHYVPWIVNIVWSDDIDP